MRGGDDRLCTRSFISCIPQKRFPFSFICFVCAVQVLSKSSTSLVLTNRLLSARHWGRSRAAVETHVANYLGILNQFKAQLSACRRSADGYDDTEIDPRCVPLGEGFWSKCGIPFTFDSAQGN